MEFTISQFISSYFPQVAVDGGYTTIFTIINTGASLDEGSLTLTDQAGNPFTVTATRPSGPRSPILSSQFLFRLSELGSSP